MKKVMNKILVCIRLCEEIVFMVINDFEINILRLWRVKYWS